MTLSVKEEAAIKRLIRRLADPKQTQAQIAADLGVQHNSVSGFGLCMQALGILQPHPKGPRTLSPRRRQEIASLAGRASARSKQQANGLRA